MHDFFNFSAVSVQLSVKQSSINSLLAPSKEQDSANLFAIARMGVPNLILPNSLDLRLSNFQNYPSYTAICDSAFPSLSQSEHAVVILRPLIVRNGLNELFFQILKANNFTVIKRKMRVLTKTEISYLAEVEKISSDNMEIYMNLMQESKVEIVILSKLGAVSDSQAIANGCAPYGRRRINQLYEEADNVRGNVDSTNAMFEISPFSSFSEVVDLEDYLIGHSKLDKYRKLTVIKTLIYLFRKEVDRKSKRGFTILRLSKLEGR